MFVIFSNNNQTLEVDGDIFFHYDNGEIIGISFKVKGEDVPEMYAVGGLWRIGETLPVPPTISNEPNMFPNDPHDEEWIDEQERENSEERSVSDLVGYENMDYTIGADNHVNYNKEIDEDFYPDRNF